MSPRRRAVISCLVLLLATAIPAGAVEDVPAYGVRPARLGEAERDGAFVVHALEAGTTVEDAIEIFNFTEAPISFEVYPVDLIATNTGSLTAASRSAEIEGPGGWITPDIDAVEVPARSSSIVSFMVDVPFGTAPGDFGAALMVEPQVSASGDATIETRTRIGIRVEIEVLGAIDLGGNLGDLEFARLPDGGRFTLDVTNTGSVTFEAVGSVAISRDGGDPLLTLSMEPQAVYVAPGDTATFTGSWDDPPVFGRRQAQAVVEVTVGDRPSTTFTGEAVTLWFIPWAEMLLVLAVLALLAWIVVKTRDRRRRWLERRREERELVQDFRSRRQSQDAEPTTGPRHIAP